MRVYGKKIVLGVIRFESEIQGKATSFEEVFDLIKEDFAMLERPFVMLERGFFFVRYNC